MSDLALVTRFHDLYQKGEINKKKNEEICIHFFFLTQVIFSKDIFGDILGGSHIQNIFLH